MAYFGVVVLLALGITCVRAPPASHTILCFECWRVRDPDYCTFVKKCHHDEICYTDVHTVNGRSLFTKGCRKTHDCGLSSYIVGKRIVPHRDHGSTNYAACEDCCQFNACNSKGCDQYLNTTTTATTKTTKQGSNHTTPAKVTTYQTSIPAGFSSLHNLQTQSTKLTSTAGNSIGQGSSCKDHEEDGIPCTYFDRYNLCHSQDPQSYFYTMARVKCPQYCGFCSASTTTSPAPTKMSSLTTKLSTVSTLPVTTTRSTLPASSVSQNSVGSNYPCTNNEDASFSCADWAKQGYCNAPTPLLQEITAMRCYKHCGFC